MVEVQDPIKRKALHTYLADNKMTDLGYDEFSKEYANNPEKFSKLYGYLKESNMTDLSSEEFDLEYFGDVKKKDGSEPTGPNQDPVSPTQEVAQKDGSSDSNSQGVSKNKEFSDTWLSRQSPLDQKYYKERKEIGDKERNGEISFEEWSTQHYLLNREWKRQKSALEFVEKTDKSTPQSSKTSEEKTIDSEVDEIFEGDYEPLPPMTKVPNEPSIEIWEDVIKEGSLTEVINDVGFLRELKKGTADFKKEFIESRDYVIPQKDEALYTIKGDDENLKGTFLEGEEEREQHKFMLQRQKSEKEYTQTILEEINDNYGDIEFLSKTQLEALMLNPAFVPTNAIKVNGKATSLFDFNSSLLDGDFVRDLKDKKITVEIDKTNKFVKNEFIPLGNINDAENLFNRQKDSGNRFVDLGEHLIKSIMQLPSGVAKGPTGTIEELIPNIETNPFAKTVLGFLGFRYDELKKGIHISDKASAALEERTQLYGDGISKSITKGNYADAGFQVANAGFEMAPLIVVSMIQPELAPALFGAQAYGEKLSGLQEEQKIAKENQEKGHVLSKEELNALQYSSLQKLGNAGATGFMNYVLFGGYIKGLNTVKKVESLTGKSLAELNKATKIGIGQGFINFGKEVVHQQKFFGKMNIGGSVIDDITNTTTHITGETIVDDMIKGVAFAVPFYATKTYKNNKALKKAKGVIIDNLLSTSKYTEKDFKTLEDINTLLEDLKRTDLSDTARNQMKADLTLLTNEVKENHKNNLKEIDKLTDAEKEMFAIDYERLVERQLTIDELGDIPAAKIMQEALMADKEIYNSVVKDAIDSKSKNPVKETAEVVVDKKSVVGKLKEKVVKAKEKFINFRSKKYHEEMLDSAEFEINRSKQNLEHWEKAKKDGKLTWPQKHVLTEEYGWKKGDELTDTQIKGLDKHYKEIHEEDLKRLEIRKKAEQEWKETGVFKTEWDVEKTEKINETKDKDKKEVTESKEKSEVLQEEVKEGETKIELKYDSEQTIYKGDVVKEGLDTKGDGVSFFTRDKESAENYTTSRQEQGQSPKTNTTFEGKLDAKNPLIVDATRPSPIELKDSKGNSLGIFGQGDYIQKVKDAGYDAIIVNRKFGDKPLDGWEIVSFKRSQIKPDNKKTNETQPKQVIPKGETKTPEAKRESKAKEVADTKLPADVKSEQGDVVKPLSEFNDKDIVVHKATNKEFEVINKSKTSKKVKLRPVNTQTQVIYDSTDLFTLKSQAKKTQQGDVVEPISDIQRNRAGSYYDKTGGRYIEKEGDKWVVKQETTGEVQGEARTLKEAKKVAHDLNLESGLFNPKTGIEIKYEEAGTTLPPKKINLTKDLKLDTAEEMLSALETKLNDFGKENLGMNIPVVIAQGAVKAMRVAIKTAKTTADIVSAGINYLKGTDWYKGLNKKDKGEAEKSLMKGLSDIINGDVKKNKREVVDTKVDELLSQGKTEEQIVESFKGNKQEQMFARDRVKRSQTVTDSEGSKIANESYEISKKELEEKLKPTVPFFTRMWRKMAREIWDSQYDVKKLIRDAKGTNPRNWMVTKKGASGYAKHNYEIAYSKIYRGLKTSSLETLDKVIFAKRIIAIDNNRASKGLNDVVHPNFQNKQTSEAYLRDLKGELGEKKYNNLINRAENYFDVYKTLLDDMYDAGIINKGYRDSFFDVDYQPREYLEFLNKLEGESGGLKGDGETTSLSSKQVKKLEYGLASGTIIDSQYLLGKSLSIRAKAIAANHATTKLKQFMGERAKEIDALREKPNRSKEENSEIRNFDKLSAVIKVNPVKKVKESGEIVYKAPPKGWKRQSYYEDGVRKELLIKDKLHDLYNGIVKSVYKTNEIREKVVLFSLSGVVKTLATGNNPTFFITNTPRDFLFISTFAKAYRSPFVPTNMAFVMKDFMTSVRSMVASDLNTLPKGKMKNLIMGSKTRKRMELYNKAMKYGIQLDFLHTQGSTTKDKDLIRAGDKIVKAFAGDNAPIVKDVAKYVFGTIMAKKLQRYTEMGLRLAVFNRSNINQFKDAGVKTEVEFLDKQSLKFQNEGDTKEVADRKAQGELDDIYTQSATEARETSDFNQGGAASKDIDAIGPYFNASIQGTRAMVEAFNDNPKNTFSKAVQTSSMLAFGAAKAGMWLLAASRGNDEPEEDRGLSTQELFLKARAGVSKYDLTNYNIIFTGKRDEEGEFEYIRIAKPHALTSIISAVEGMQDHYLKGQVGDTSESTAHENVSFALNNNISPIEFKLDPIEFGKNLFTKTPIVKAVLSSALKYDFFRNQPLSHKQGSVEDEALGYENKKVEDFYKKLGIKFNISPIGTKAAFESIFTTPNVSPWVGLGYGFADMIPMETGDKGIKMFDSYWEKTPFSETVSKSFTGRLFKTTSEYNRLVDTDEIIKENSVEEDINKLIEDVVIKKAVKKYKDAEGAEKVKAEKELWKLMEDVVGENKFKLKKTVNKVVGRIKSPETSQYYWDLKFGTPKERALILEKFFGDAFNKKIPIKDVKKSVEKQYLELFNELIDGVSNGTDGIFNEETLTEYVKLVEAKKKKGSTKK